MKAIWHHTLVDINSPKIKIGVCVCVGTSLGMNETEKAADSQLRKPKVKFFVPGSTRIHKGTYFKTENVDRRPAMFPGDFLLLDVPLSNKNSQS